MRNPKDYYYSTDSYYAINILNTISQDNPSICKAIEICGGAAKLTKFLKIKPTGSRYSHLIHEEGVREAKELLTRISA